MPKPKNHYSDLYVETLHKDISVVEKERDALRGVLALIGRKATLLDAYLTDLAETGITTDYDDDITIEEVVKWAGQIVAAVDNALIPNPTE